MLSLFISLEEIFSSITWEERSYIYRSLDKGHERYTENKSSKAMIFLWFTLWIFVAINTMIKLN